MREVVYKIVHAREWDEAVIDGLYYGSLDDVRDGFIHFSTAEQLPGTAAKHFRGKSDLLLLACGADHLGPYLKWEPSRGGALFPHLYGYLPVGSVERLWPLGLDADGVPILPALTERA